MLHLNIYGQNRIQKKDAKTNMANELVTTSNIYNVIRRAFGFMNQKILQHGEITAYIFYNMLKADGSYTDTELAEYALVGMMHDIGLIKTGYNREPVHNETHNVWAHSVYGYLFLKYLSPVGKMADVVLYHHLPYNRHSMIKSSQMKAAEYLALADKMDVFMRMEGHGMEQDYFVRKANIEFSGKALEMFYAAQTKFSFMNKLTSDKYQQELAELFENVTLTEKQKKGFLEMLIYAIDFRSQQTVMHTMSTKTFAIELGRLMRVPAADLQVLYYGSLMHDIGKIVIPLSILEAPRRLTDEEMRVMKAHVVISDKILRGIFDDRIVDVASKHHEKLDGSGYPAGLKGDDITLLERITAVADILSALYGKRSYKDSFSPEKVKSILQEDAQKGKICKKVVDVAISNFDTIINNYEKQRSSTMERYMEILQQYDSIYERFKEFE